MIFTNWRNRKGRSWSWILAVRCECDCEWEVPLRVTKHNLTSRQECLVLISVWTCEALTINSQQTARSHKFTGSSVVTG